MLVPPMPDDAGRDHHQGGAMSWVRIESRTPMHPKFATLSPAAGWLWITGLCHCGEYLTDGRIKAGVPARLVNGYKKAWADELVRAGLWTETKDGWQVHDYLEFQPSAEAEHKRRKEDAERKAKARAEKAARAARAASLRAVE